MSVFGMGTEATSASPSKVSDSRAVVDAFGIAATGNKNKLARDNGIVGNNNRTVRDSGLLMEGSSIGGNLILSDQGAIAAAFDFARQTSAAASAQFDSVFQTAGSLVEQGADMNDTDKQNRKTLMIGAGVVVALVALWILNK